MSDNSINLNSNNNSLHEFSQIIKNFDKINIIEIEPATENINEGKCRKTIKQCVLNHINNKTKLNKQRAIKLYQKAAKLQNIVAQLDLTEIYIHVTESDDDLAFNLSKNLAKKEYAGGLNNLGWCYENGIGTDAYDQKAFDLYQKAADLGNINGIINFGWCYSEGIGTYVDKQKAFELYLMAANFENDFAQYCIAKMYKDGDGINVDIDQAIYWYKKSAEQGNQSAQDKLNELLEE
ncbi:kinase-like domain-containing protein [Rhizophagus irregularis DAOM 181602=DAOM 197198]|nr:kinase-like domain-containing protein [Rhizophagus irregularis DAOM 181602=DAOM 197198]